MQQQIITTARSFLNTPFVHQGRSKEGLDCLGLLILIARNLNLKAKDGTPMHCHDNLCYSRTPNSQILYETLKHCLHEIDAPQLGSVALLNIAGNAQHLAIIGDYVECGFSLIHAYQTAGKVIENNYDASWQRRTFSYFHL
jgi:cell wall-associated NlpC family hydrolase